jgi:signal transduction histidine kinase
MIGAIFSLILWFIFLNHTQYYLSWMFLIFGFTISFLIAKLIHTIHLTKYRENILNETNKILENQIHDKLQAEQSQKKLEIALLQQQKLQALGTLVSGIAHDFNNILYAILGYSEMAQSEVSPQTTTYRNLGKIIEATHRGQALIARILAFSRSEHHQFEVIDLKRTIEAALSLLKSTIPASVLIHFEPAEASIMGNQTQIHQVLVNLINNAVDAMDREGTITLRMTHIKENDPILKQFPDTQAQAYCKIEIIDTGRGMDQTTIERIFEPFFTTKEAGKGTGLGLSIVHTIIKKHQGAIDVSTQLGQGTKFMILLPIYPAQRGNNG